MIPVRQESGKNARGTPREGMQEYHEISHEEEEERHAKTKSREDEPAPKLHNNSSIGNLARHVGGIAAQNINLAVGEIVFIEVCDLGGRPKCVSTTARYAAVPLRHTSSKS